MIDTVVFDLGNVLVDFNWKGYLNGFQFEPETYQRVAKAMFLNEDWELGDSGTVTPKQWLQHFIANDPPYEKEIRRVYETLGNCILPYAYTAEWIRYYREKGFRIFFLSNYSEGLYEKTTQQLAFTQEFDGGLFSYREKCMKPQLEIYTRLLARYQIVPEQTLFFDDREDNIAAAKSIGLQGILFTPGTEVKAMQYVENTGGIK